MAVVACLLASLLAAVPAAIAPPAAAESGTAGGPLVLMGIDAEDGGVGGHGPIENYIQLVDSVLADVTNGGSNGLLVIGGGKSATDNVTSFWNAVAAGLDAGAVDGTAGEPVTYVNGATNISSQTFGGFEVIGVVSSSYHTPSGGLTSAENDALAARESGIARFINDGGGLVGFEQGAFAAPFNYLASVGSFSVSTADYSNIDPTLKGRQSGSPTRSMCAAGMRCSTPTRTG